ncbi:MAG: DUF2892 domain-containing protein [Acetobacteraceae bacterium]|nr:DUF2892 domain-containing protein [Acetobacteraceae bacterium]
MHENSAPGGAQLVDEVADQHVVLDVGQLHCLAKQIAQRGERLEQPQAGQPGAGADSGLGPLCVVGTRCLRVFGFVGAIGLVPIATALIGWCPADPLLGINTCARKS